jgi:DNA repair exonuclease SbcCD ATPase subunit
MNNIFVKDAIKAKKELENDKNRAKNISTDRANIVAEIVPISGIMAEYEQYNSKLNEIKKLKMELLKLDSQRSTLENKINLLKSDSQKISEKIEKYYKSKKDIEKNKIIEKEIANLKSEMYDLSIEFDEVEDELRETYSKIIFLEEKKRVAIESLEKFKDMEEKNVSYQYYLQAIHRDSIPYELISEVIPAIEKEVNNILLQVVDFAIMLELDGKNINAKIVYDENKIWPLEMASGMEKFITGMAIRVSLVNITNLPRPNFLAVDEGWSALDSDNYSNLPVVLDYLKMQFDFIFVISHMDSMRDFVDISLDLKKDADSFSKLTFV